MSGPMLSMAAPVVEAGASSVAVAAVAPFHRSHSTPDLLHSLAKPPPPPPTVGSKLDCPPAAVRTQQQRASLLFKSLPSLPAFDVPSFDLSAELEKSFRINNKAEPLTLTIRGPTDGNVPVTSSASDKNPPPRKTTTQASQSLAVGSPAVERPATSAAAPVRPPPQATGRTRSMIDRSRSWLPSSRSAPNVRNAVDEHPKRTLKNETVVVAAAAAIDEPVADKPLERSRTVESFADYAKRSWISSSRSPSPPSKGQRKRASSSSKTSTATSRSRSNSDAPRPTESQSSTSRALNRASLYLTKIKLSKGTSPAPSSAESSSDPDDVPVSKSSRASAAPAATGGGKTAAIASASAPNLSTLSAYTPLNSGSLNSTSRNSSHTASSLDTDGSASSTSENASQSTEDTSITIPPSLPGDPLWSTFRTLDIEFTRFAAKGTTAGRMGVVRGTLMPFLRSTAHHPSNSSRSILTAEDVDRRATILHRWWNGLLEMLDAGQSRLPVGSFGLAAGIASLGPQLPVLQPVPGVDRPTLLEVTTMIMMRPEWRVCTSYLQPLAERSPEERVRARSGTTSTVGSTDMEQSIFLEESAEHNVRTMFVTTLMTQMALVVEKMSLRHAPISLVNWCGKACAYAFFFAPGVADVLVRLWGLHPDLLRRVADEFGLPRRSKGESEDIVALFPPHLHKLGWSSVKTLGDKLRQPAKLPLMAAKIPWHSPWVARWRGGDTDLLFIFVKYFYILADEFMPDGLPLVEKARGPAFVPVHAQLLSVLDSTVHRQASIDALLGPPMSDGIHGADASLAGLSLPSNLLKGMDENRMIVLLKDILSESSIGIAPGIKHAFAEAFVAVTKAATKRTPQHEHNSCFVLLDFLEEALGILDAFQNAVNYSTASSPTEESVPLRSFELGPATRTVDYIDWPFWFEVGKLIMNSNNTMSEIRVLSFIFSVWDAITADSARKEAACLDWLLTEEVFEKFFNNWCPMVRAYYMRLLCWRICRDSGSANEVDTKIFMVVAQRLKTVWSHYLWLKQDAESRGRLPPSTAPSYPTPGKRFLIIRTEIPPAQPSLHLGFDSFSSSFGGSDMSDFYGPLAGTDDAAAGGKSDTNSTSYKKKWGLLGKVLSFSGSQANGTGGKRTWEEELEQARRETAASRVASRALQQPLGPPTPPKQEPSTAATPSSDSISSTGSSPIYEASTYVFRFALSGQGAPGGPMFGGLPPSQNRILSKPRLPAPSQARVSARSAILYGGDASSRGSAAFRNDSPPPVAAGLPPATRRVSGGMQTGLISEARNAKPLSLAGGPFKSDVDKVALDKRLSLNVSVASVGLADEAGRDDDRFDLQSPLRLSNFDSDSERGRSFVSGVSETWRSQAPSVLAQRPMGIYAAGAVYAGRALAEWSIVVNECNSFVDRRRDEGVLGLSDVEVPSLGVDGLGMRQRG